MAHLLKFKPHAKSTAPLPSTYAQTIAEINRYRSFAREWKMIGVDVNKQGYGNMSMREKGNKFIITGTQTSGLERLTNQHFALILEMNNEYCVYTGATEPPSQTPTHDAIYSASPSIMAVMHVHDGDLWHKLKHKIPTTPDNAEYASLELRTEIGKVCKGDNGLIVLGGHWPGLMAYGKDMQQAMDEILKFY